MSRLGLLPTHTNAYCASITFPLERVATALPSTTSQVCTPIPVITLILSFLNCLSSCLATSLSSFNSIWSTISTIVTSVPKALKNCPISHPITPPPTINIDSGISSSPRTSSLVITTFPSYGNILGTTGTEPFASIILSAFIVSTVPSSLVTSIVFLSINFPKPLTKFTPLFSNKNSIPLINWFTTLFFLSIMAVKFGLTVPSISIPKSFASFTVFNTPEEARSALVGIHPAFKQVPPTLLFSTTVTSAPSIEAFIAATYPPGPPPTTTIFIFNSPKPNIIYNLAIL